MDSRHLVYLKKPLQGDRRIYTPAFVLKEAEAATLSSLPAAFAELIFPLLSVGKIKKRSDAIRDDGTKRIARPQALEEFAKVQSELIKTILRPSMVVARINSAMLDTSALDEQAKVSTLMLLGQHLTMSERRLLIPVVRVAQSRSVEADVKAWAKEFETGFALRWIRKQRRWPAIEELMAALKRVGGRTINTDLVIDADHIRDLTESDTVAVEVEGLIRQAAGEGVWRSIILISGAFPQTLSQFPFDSFVEVDRADLSLWTSLCMNLERTKFPMPAYGDFGVVFPTAMNGGSAPEPNGRYTDEAVFRILRKQGSAMGLVCQAIATESWFRGRSFSAGDEWIDQVARRQRTKTGNAMIWNKVGLQHHVAYTVRQINGQL